MSRPAYLRIAADLRVLIEDGDLPPGARLPSRAELSRRYGVSDRVAVEAVRVLVAEGLVEGRPGSGTYVRRRVAVRTIPRGLPSGPGTVRLRRDATWKAVSETRRAGPRIARRLGVPVGAEVMSTEYRCTDGAGPAVLAMSWEPLELTGGTEVRRPEDGPFGGAGVVRRMAAIGVAVTRARESVSARPVTEREAGLLDVPLHAVVVTISRTYFAAARPVETADLVLAADRYELRYEFPVQPPP